MSWGSGEAVALFQAAWSQRCQWEVKRSAADCLPCTQTLCFNTFSCHSSLPESVLSSIAVCRFLQDLEHRLEKDILRFDVCDIVLDHCPALRRVYLPYVTNQAYQEQTYQRLLWVIVFGLCSVDLFQISVRTLGAVCASWLLLCRSSKPNLGLSKRNNKEACKSIHRSWISSFFSPLWPQTSLSLLRFYMLDH